MSVVAVRIEDGSLRSLTALSKLEGGNAGSYIRSAVAEYLDRRKSDVETAMSALNTHEMEMLRALLGPASEEQG